MPPAKATETKAPELEERDHQRGCPVVTGDSDRGSPIEQYEDTVPATATGPAKKVLVTRCVQCGGHRVDPV